MVVSDPRQADNPIVFANEAFCSLTGYARDELVGRNCRLLQGEETDPADAARIGRAVAQGAPIDVEILNYRKNGQSFWNRISISPVRDHGGQVVFFFASQRDASAERHARDVNEYNQRRLDDLIGSSSDVRFQLNADWSELQNLQGGNFIPNTTTGSRTWIEDYIPREDQPALRAEIRRAVETRTSYLLEHRVNRVDGTIGWALSRAIPILDRGGAVTGWFGAASDITQRKRVEGALLASEARLRESEAYWRGLFEELNESFMVVEVVRDAAGIARTWRFVDVNAAWERISGLSQAAAIGREVEEVIPGVERDWIDIYLRVAESGEPASFRMPVQALGHVYDVWAFRVAADRVGVLFHEVSAEQRAELRRAAMLELHERLRDLRDAAAMAFLAAEITGRALGIDRAAYATIGADGETLLIERDWTSPGFPGSAGTHRIERDAPAFADLRRGDIVVIDDVARDPEAAHAPDDPIAPAPTRALVKFPLREGGRLVAVFVVNGRAPRAWQQDEVTFVRIVAEHTRSAIERRRAEAELRDLAAALEHLVEHRTRELTSAQAALAQSQKMEAMGQLTGGVAHDFNNLLTVISASTDTLVLSELSEASRARHAQTMADAVGRAVRLTGQLLAFARRQELKPEVFVVCDRIRGIGDMMRTLAGSRIRIVMDLPVQNNVVKADAGQFDIALVNMAVNARDAMDGEGTLTIGVQAVDRMPALRGQPEMVAPFAAISVTDTGSGIPEDKLEAIFEPFYTTKPVGTGTGLGLSQVFGFAKQSGGEVVVASRLGEGSTFTLYLPRMQAGA